MRRLSPVLALCLVMPSALSLAASEGPDNTYDEYAEAETKKAEASIPALIRQYATSLGCAFYMDPSNVVPYPMSKLKGPKPSAPGSRLKVFVVVFSLDEGCSGGSQMSRPVFAVVRHGFPFTMVVDATFSAPHQTSEDFPSVVTHIFLKDGELWYMALAHDFSKDALCCPSVSITGRLVFEGRMWKGIPERSVSLPVVSAPERMAPECAGGTIGSRSYTRVHGVEHSEGDPPSEMSDDLTLWSAPTGEHCFLLKTFGLDSEMCIARGALKVQSPQEFLFELPENCTLAFEQKGASIMLKASPNWRRIGQGGICPVMAECDRSGSIESGEFSP